jgi:hypothetical protein
MRCACGHSRSGGRRSRRRKAPREFVTPPDLSPRHRDPLRFCRGGNELVGLCEGVLERLGALRGDFGKSRQQSSRACARAHQDGRRGFARYACGVDDGVVFSETVFDNRFHWSRVGLKIYEFSFRGPSPPLRFMPPLSLTQATVTMPSNSAKPKNPDANDVERVPINSVDPVLLTPI